MPLRSGETKNRIKPMNKTRGFDLNLGRIWYNFSIVCVQEERVRKPMACMGNKKGMADIGDMPAERHRAV